MVFEYDTDKSAANKRKHGLNFEEAQALWQGVRIEIQAAYRAEPRHAVIGMVDGAYWTAIITYRGENVRLISCRRSHPKEVLLYERNTGRN
jgi:uncharacterized DUF497 family protein